MSLTFSFGSDNHSGVHEEVLKSIEEAASGPMRAYGADPFTAKATELVRKTFGEQSEVYFLWTGTAANTLAIKALCRSHEAVITTDTAHIQQDECGAPEFIAGSKILTFPSQNGKLTPEAIQSLHIDLTDPHRVTPKLISITQSTELGTVYTLDELRLLTSLAHKRGLLVHMDGARLANAAAALACPLADITTEIGIDALSFGGTKNGLLGAEALIFLKRGLAPHFPFVRKQAMHLASKMRFLSCQFIAYLEKDLWQKNALQANKIAHYLRKRLEETTFLGQLTFPLPTEANAVFVEVPAEFRTTFEECALAYRWGKTWTRLVCSFESTETQVEEFLSQLSTKLSKAHFQHGPVQ